MFKRVDNNIDLAKNEDKTAKYWDEINAFHNSTETSNLTRKNHKQQSNKK